MCFRTNISIKNPLDKVHGDKSNLNSVALDKLLLMVNESGDAFILSGINIRSSIGSNSDPVGTFKYVTIDPCFWILTVI